MNATHRRVCRLVSLGALAGLFILVSGCGGSGGSADGGPGPGGPAPVPAGEPLATAKVMVDVDSGLSTVIPLTGDTGRAVLAGSAVEVRTERLVDDPGERTRRILRVEVVNRLREIIGSPTGLEIGVRSVKPLASPPQDLSSQRTFSTYSGTGTSGSADGPLGTSTFNSPTGLATDGSSNTLFVSEGNGIRRISNGLTSTIAGPLGSIGDVVFYEGYLYFTVSSNHTVCRIPAAGGAVEVIAGQAGSSGLVNGDGATARLNTPRGLAIFQYNGTYTIAVADAGNNAVRLISNFLFAPEVTTLSSTVSGAADITTMPTRPSFGIEADIIACTSSSGHRVHVFRLSDGVSNTVGSGVAGSTDGNGAGATFNQPWGIMRHGAGFLVSEGGTGRVRQMALIPGGNPLQSSSWYLSRYNTPTTPGAANGSGLTAQTGGRLGMLFWNNEIYFADSTRHFIRRIGASEGWQQVMDGSAWGPGAGEILVANQDFRRQYALGGTSTEEENVYVRQQLYPDSSTSLDLVVAIPSGVRAFEFLLTVSASVPGDSALSGGIGQASSDVILQTLSGAVAETGWVDGQGTQVRHITPRFGGSGFFGLVFLADIRSGVDRIRVLDPQSGKVRTIIGLGSSANNAASGTGATATYDGITGLVAMKHKGILYFSTPTGIYMAQNVSDLTSFNFEEWTKAANWQVRLISGDTTVSGDAYGDGLTARYSSAEVLLADTTQSIFLVDGAHRIKRLKLNNDAAPELPPSYSVSLFSGSTTSGFANGNSGASRYNGILGMAPAASGGYFVADSGNHLVRLVTQAGGSSTLAGGAGASGYVDASGTGARFSGIQSIASDAFGFAYIVEPTRVRRVSPGGEVRTILNGSTFRDGIGPTAGFGAITSITMGQYGEILVTDGSTIRRVSRIVRTN